MQIEDSIIRPELRQSDIKRRGAGMSPTQLQAVKDGLRTLHRLELMALTIYRFQITSHDTELNRHLIAAMCNEMTHYQDFQVKLNEHGLRPNSWRWMYWIVGFTLGYFSRLLGKRTILKIGIWVESKAVNHYSELLADIDWDDDTRRIIEKNQSDEHSHIERWSAFLKLEEKL